MKLFLKQVFPKNIPVKPTFEVKDNDGNLKYHCEGELLRLLTKIHIRNAQMQELAMITQKASLQYTYRLFKNGEEVDIIKKAINIIPEYKFVKKGWSAKGNFTSHDYKIIAGNGAEVASVHKVWLSSVDYYEIDYHSEADEVDIIALILSIDSVLATWKK